jgi:copper transport protein
MRPRSRWIGVAVAAGVIVGLIAAPAASAHAYLIKTTPTASQVLNAPPQTIALTYDEAVEPRFAIISVTDVSGTQETAGAVRRSPGDPDTLTVAVRPGLPEGWYLIYWRAISVDGHPVQGAYTYAVGPNPGPAPRFAVPTISGSATSPEPLVARTVMFLAVMISIGLFVMRFLLARSLVRRAGPRSLRPLSIAFAISSVIGLVAIFAYLDASTAIDSLRSVFDLATLVPLFGVTAFGRGYLDMLICFALFCFAGWVSLSVDRSDRTRRSLAELAAHTGALLAAGAVLIIPGTSGHAAQTAPRGLTLGADWVHLVSGSVWLGGLVGLLILWGTLGPARRVEGLALVAPRFSKLALASVTTLAASGIIEAIDHMPAIEALWRTGYGVAILVKVAILLAAMLLASGNLLRSAPQLFAARADVSRGAAAVGLLGRLVCGETVLVAGAVFVAALLSSLAPPPPAFALQNAALAQIGPGQTARSVSVHGYRLSVLVSPNKAAAPNAFALRITHAGRPVDGATVTLTFNQTEMEMPEQEYGLRQTGPGTYARSAPALIMVGNWNLAFQVTPPGAAPFTANILDEARG